MQPSRNTARRLLEYQNRINSVAAHAAPSDRYNNTNMPGYISAAAPTAEPEGMNELSNQPLSLAMAYVPYQQFRDLYEPEEALNAGTLFRELDKPFYGSRRRMA